MVNFIIVLLSGVVFGAVAAFLSFKWAWDWFGDIWHQTTMSSLWMVLYIALFIINILLVKFSPKFFPGFSMYWWHYLVSILFFLTGSAICVFWAVNK